ncbi:calcineurin B homologous protein 1-like [Simochromis diagramma]|uniref:calcineurin B homologous protein 1-like n=1 Tax=Simochromis diagramma TaxID=43689 RepID=UPI001A7EF2B3|nr:calcineurin B homologous protein 1-like [Simochromis diagramma]
MGSRASRLLREEEIEEIKKETGFSHRKITRLYRRFTSLDKGENGTLSREDFQRIPELAINPLGDIIINAFFPEGEDQVNFRGFMRTLAHFRPIEDNEKNKNPSATEPLNSRTNKLLFAFRLYDLDRDDKISRDELLQVLRMMVTDLQLRYIGRKINSKFLDLTPAAFLLTEHSSLFSSVS